MKGAILDAISNEIGIFVSDLKNPHCEMQLIEVLKKTPWAEYSLAECNYSLSYIFKKALVFTSVKDVLDFVNAL